MQICEILLTNIEILLELTSIGDDFDYRWGWPKGSGPTGGGEIPRHFLIRRNVSFLTP
jgi:hypothetical protein